MITFYSLDEINHIDRTVVALGNFDGIHRGHQALIKRAVSIAKEKKLKSAVFTFTDHPRNVLSGKQVVKNIIYEDEKIEILEKMGIDYLFSLDFELLKEQSPEDFVDQILIGAFHIDTAVCGFNFTYGYRAEGTPHLLVEDAARKGFQVSVVDPVMIRGQVVSSTLIREKILCGELEAASEMLGRTYSIRGTIVRGNQIGRTIGFPTCNITVDAAMVAPPNGVYVTRARIDDRIFDSMTNIGRKPTVGEYETNIETNILEFHEDVYGKMIRVEFICKIRDEKKFSGLEELKKQIGRDRQYAIRFHQESVCAGA